MNQPKTCPRCGEFQAGSALCSACLERAEQDHKQAFSDRLKETLGLQLILLLIASILGLLFNPFWTLKSISIDAMILLGWPAVFILIIAGSLFKINGLFASIVLPIPLIFAEAMAIKALYKRPQRSRVAILSVLTALWFIVGVFVIFNS